MSTQKTLYDEPLQPPVDGMVLRVSKWPETFETGKTQSYKRLSHVLLPNRIEGRGIRHLKKSYSDPQTRSLILMHWHLLLMQVSRHDRRELRGHLCGSQGEPWGAWEIIDEAHGFGDAEHCDMMLEWALQVGWLEWAYPGDPYVQETAQPVASSTKRQPQQIPQLSTEWSAIERRLGECGVSQSAQAIRSAQSLQWSPDHAIAVIRHFVEHAEAWNAGALYRRFQCPVTLPIDRGWPALSAEFQQRRLAEKQRRHLEQQAKETMRRSQKTGIEPYDNCFGEYAKTLQKEKR